MAVQAILQQVTYEQKQGNMLSFDSMEFQLQKGELIQLILETQDEALVGRIREYIQEYKDDFWHTLPEHVKQSVETGRQQAAKGQLISFEEFQKNARELRKELRKRS